MVVPTAISLIYSAISDPFYYPRYLFFTTPAMAVVLAVCIVGIARKPRWIAAILIVLTVAAFPNYLLSQRQRYAKESWDYSDVADLISAQAAPGDCLLVDNTVGWLPGPVRAVLAARPAAYRPLVDVGRGVPAAKRETLWDGHVAVWLVVGRLYQCTTLWTISTHDTKLPNHQTRDVAAARTDAGARARLHDREKCRVPHRRAVAVPPSAGHQVDPLTPASSRERGRPYRADSMSVTRLLKSPSAVLGSNSPLISAANVLRSGRPSEAPSTRLSTAEAAAAGAGAPMSVAMDCRG